MRLKANSKEYKNLAIQITGTLADANRPEELFAFAIETAKGKVDNKLALEIYRLARKIK